jgi:ribosomal protein S27AE
VIGWNSHSLLGTYALMILEGLTGKRRVMHCPECGGFFLSAVHQSRFCSSTCRSTHHKREWRKAKKQGALQEQTGDEVST